MVRHLEFDRLIQSESETSSGREHHNSGVTAAKYTFTLAGKRKSARCFSGPFRNAKMSVCLRGKYGSTPRTSRLQKSQASLLKDRLSGSIELTLSGDIKELMVFGFLAVTRRSST
jgi:hypothetical protein